MHIGTTVRQYIYHMLHILAYTLLHEFTFILEKHYVAVKLQQTEHATNHYECKFSVRQKDEKLFDFKINVVQIVYEL